MTSKQRSITIAGGTIVLVLLIALIARVAGTDEHRRVGSGTVSPAAAQQDAPDAGAIADLTDRACIPVTNRIGDTMGCVRHGDEYPDPTANNTVDPRGIPVYATEGSDTIVGFMGDGIGFVPLALADRETDLRTCSDGLRAHLVSGAAQVSEDCFQLLTAQGYPDWIRSK